jgi:hypothetical protein
VRLRAAVAVLALIGLAAAPAFGQRLLLGRWLGTIDGTAAVLTIITADSEGRVHGTMVYDPPLGGFAGAPFTSHIVDGSFAIRFADGSRYDGIHWCGTTLCGIYVALDGSATPAGFARPAD